MIGIADTGFLVAFLSRQDEHHSWAMSLAEQISEPLLTCEAVLAETAFHLRDCGAVLAMLNERFVTLAFDCNDHVAQLEDLARRFADRTPDLADLCLIRMSELFPKHPVITVDREDFRVYRRNRRETIPLICPPVGTDSREERTRRRTRRRAVRAGSEALGTSRPTRERLRSRH